VGLALLLASTVIEFATILGEEVVKEIPALFKALLNVVRDVVIPLDTIVVTLETSPIRTVCVSYCIVYSIVSPVSKEIESFSCLLVVTLKLYIVQPPNRGTVLRRALIKPAS